MPRIETRARLRTLTRGKHGALVAAPKIEAAAAVVARHTGRPAPADPSSLDPALPDNGAHAQAADNLRPPAHEAPPMPDDPLRPSILPASSRNRWVLRARRAARWLAARLPWREPTAAERKLRSEMQERRMMERLLREESVEYRKRLTNALDRLGFCYRYPRSERSPLADLVLGGVRSVQFDEIRMQPEALYYHLDTRRLPRGVHIPALLEPNVLTDLTISCGRRVTAEYSEQIGAWYIVERGGAARGLPAHVSFGDLMERFGDKDDPLAIAVGLTANNRPVFRSLSQTIHLLVGGVPGSGKSNFINAMLCTWIARNHPDELRLVMVDLKGGLELDPYMGVPHVHQVPDLDPIINQREDVPRMLDWLLEEGERRIGKLHGKHRSIASYNKNRQRDRMPRIVLVIDEYADIALHTELKREVERRLTNICQRFRAVGVHVVLCTQRPEANIVSPNIKGVMQAKVAFNCANNASSMVMLDNTDAKGLAPVGRAMLQESGMQTLVQTPYMPDDLVAQVIAAAKAGQHVAPVVQRKHDVTADEVMRWALDQAGGELASRRVYQTFRGRGMGLREVETWLQSWDGQEYVVNGALYRVEPGTGTRPRQLVAVGGKHREPGMGTHPPA